jgi:hypothetical protein
MQNDLRQRWIQLLQKAATERDSGRFDLLAHEIKQVAAEIIREGQGRESVKRTVQ